MVQPRLCSIALQPWKSSWSPSVAVAMRHPGGRSFWSPLASTTAPATATSSNSSINTSSLSSLAEPVSSLAASAESGGNVSLHPTPVLMAKMNAASAPPAAAAATPKPRKKKSVDDEKDDSNVVTSSKLIRRMAEDNDLTLLKSRQIYKSIVMRITEVRSRATIQWNICARTLTVWS
jgi:hypothetical protein